MHIIHIIDSLAQVNYGIWSAVIANFPAQIAAGLKPELWVKGAVDIPDKLKDFAVRFVEDLKDEVLLNESLGNEAMIVSHGCWLHPTQWGKQLKAKGYPWLAVPHGMLEPWSMSQKRLKKWAYFHLVEKPSLKKGDHLVAVSQPEQQNLERMFQRPVSHIPNGIQPYLGPISKSTEKVVFLFMARLHHKKGIVPLVKAWMDSVLASESSYELQIIGPDDGEQTKLEALLQANNVDNISLLGPKYGKEKEELLHAAHVYILPSFSEGFPSSILEAATHGCWPVFTEGCNFPEAFEAGVAKKIKPEQTSIEVALNDLANVPVEQIIAKGREAKVFVDKNYNLERIGKMWVDLIEEVMGRE